MDVVMKAEDNDDFLVDECSADNSARYRFPTDPKKIKARIRSYERKLRDEKRRCGGYHDSYGRRFLVGPLCLAMGDVDTC